MEYLNQRGGVGERESERDISPMERAPLAGLPVMPRLEDMTNESGCGCETPQPVCPIPSTPTPCPQTCHACGEDSWGLEGYPLAMVYAPCQAFRHLYDLDTALERGTLFSELDLPIETAGGVSGKGCGCSWNQQRRS